MQRHKVKLLLNSKMLQCYKVLFIIYRIPKVYALFIPNNSFLFKQTPYTFINNAKTIIILEYHHLTFIMVAK